MGGRALLKIGRMCTSDCVFCHAGGPAPGSALSLREVCRRVLSARDLGFEGVVLSGGEPTAHPEFSGIVKLVERAGLRLGLITNGIALSRPALLRAVAGAGLTVAHVTLLGPDAGTHDRLAGVRSFHAARSAIERLAAIPEVELAVTTVVTSANLDSLDRTVDLVSGLLERSRATARPSHRLALLEPKGRAAGRADLVPDPAAAAAAMARAIEHGSRSHGAGVRRGFDGLPSCLTPAPAGPDGGELLDLRAYGITHMQEADEDRLFPVDAGHRSFAGRCVGCASRSECAGLYSGYLPLYERSLAPRAPS